MKTNLPPMSDLCPRVVHFDASQPSPTLGGPLQLHPLRGQTAMRGRGPPRGFYTLDAARVTCKKCLRGPTGQTK